MAKKSLFVTVLLDNTGSMERVREATVSGFNEYLSGLRVDPSSNVLLTLKKFNSATPGSYIETAYNDVSPRDVRAMTLEDYRPNGGTPLYDALAYTILDIERRVKPKAKVLICVVTDGEENSSKEWNRQRVFDLITRKQSEGWAFVYLGANQDAWRVSESIGVYATNTMPYDASHPKQAWLSVNSATSGWSGQRGMSNTGLLEVSVKEYRQASGLPPVQVNVKVGRV